MNSCNGCCEHCEHKLCAKRVPIFSILDTSEISKVVELIIRKQYAKGELIILEGSTLDRLIIINSGQAKAFRDTMEGKEQILYIFSEGDFFGEKNLLSNQKATYHVEALETTNVCMIRKSDFRQLLTTYPEIGFKIMEELCRRLEHFENALESMGTKDVDTRVNAVLIEFAQKFGKKTKDGILVDLPLSREGIANYIGLTRETVSRKMNRLQEEGIIKNIGNKKVLLSDLSWLQHNE